MAKNDGGRILTGGNRIMTEPFNHGYFVEPTIIDGLPKDHSLFKEELFVPITVLTDVMTLDEAIDLANDTEYGLTAGIFSEDDKEIETVLRTDRGGRDLRQPQERRDHWRLARHQPVRRLEGQRRHRPRHRRPVVRPAVHAGAIAGAYQVDTTAVVNRRNVGRPYSLRSAISGSTRDARSAGPMQAATTTRHSTSATAR